MTRKWFLALLTRQWFLKPFKHGPGFPIWHAGLHRQLFGVDMQVRTAALRSGIVEMLLVVSASPRLTLKIQRVWPTGRYQWDGHLEYALSGPWNEPVEPNLWNSQHPCHPGRWQGGGAMEQLLLESGGAFRVVRCLVSLISFISWNPCPMSLILPSYT